MNTDPVTILYGRQNFNLAHHLEFTKNTRGKCCNLLRIYKEHEKENDLRTRMQGATSLQGNEYDFSENQPDQVQSIITFRKEAVVSTLLSLLLHGLHEYGYPVLWLAVFIAAVGFPLPTPLILLAAGAFAVHGDFNIVLLLGITLTAASCGDNVGYFIGRRWGGRPLNWLVQSRRLHVIPVGMIARSRLYFKRRGAWAIFFSRFLLPALGGVTNLLAGAEHYPYRSFLVCDITGDALGVAIPLSLGYGLGACWKAGGNLLSIVSWVIFLLFLAVLLVRRLLLRRRALGLLHILIELPGAPG